MHTFTLPSGTEIQLVEMTGVEEDFLTNQRLTKSGEPMNHALARSQRSSSPLPPYASAGAACAGRWFPRVCFSRSNGMIFPSAHASHISSLSQMRRARRT